MSTDLLISQPSSDTSSSNIDELAHFLMGFLLLEGLPGMTNGEPKTAPAIYTSADRITRVAGLGEDVHARSQSYGDRWNVFVEEKV